RADTRSPTVNRCGFDGRCVDIGLILYAAGSNSFAPVVISLRRGFQSVDTFGCCGHLGKVAPSEITISSPQHWLRYTPNFLLISPLCGTCSPHGHAGARARRAARSTWHRMAPRRDANYLYGFYKFV